MNRVYNFNAGPAKLPRDVLIKTQQELLNWQNTGASVMELSHRGKEFDHCALEATQDLRDILSIPENYKVLFLQGGARAQFAAVPMNLLGQNSQADYVNSGYWSQCAIEEAKKYCQVNALGIQYIKDGKKALKPMTKWQLNKQSAYVHYCPNETIDGLALFDDPIFDNKVVVADFSSTILSQPIDVSRYGIIYAGAQKNIGPSGITIVIVREDLLGRAQNIVPDILNYQVQTKADSMFNTPPTFAWYMAGQVFKWIKSIGGLPAMAELNNKKASLLYQCIDQSDFYQNDITAENRSIMNVPFISPNEILDKLFVNEASKHGILGIKGHRIVGGMRASIYNAVELEEVQYLVDFMKEFERKNG